MLRNNKKIIDEYDSILEPYNDVAVEADRLINSSLDHKSSMKIVVNSRIKTKSSLKKKIEKNDDKYRSIEDITDILGIRIICYFVDDIERISSVIEDIFDIDYENSADKSKLLNPNAFGYLSVHYVCSLKKGGSYSDEMCKLKFEIQIRTLLQHVWAEIEHDLGYKSEFAIPRSIRRDFSRVAGLLELADEKFSDIKNNLDGYTGIVRTKIAENDVEDIYIDKISFNEYVFNNVYFKKYCDKFSEGCKVDITLISPELYLKQMTWLDINTLAEFNKMVAGSGESAIIMMRDRLADYKLDIITSNAVIRSLCYAELVRRNYDKPKIMDFLMIAVSEENAEKIANKLLNYRNK